MRPSRRTWRTAAASAVVVLAMLGLVVVAPPAAAHPGDTIVVTTTIQAAVDAAEPGDTILVPPATYHESVLIGVDSYHLTGTRYVDNPVYGPFPVCSRNGLVNFNRVVGGGSAAGPSADTGIYVGDDDQVTVRHNSVSNYVIVALLPYHPRPFTDHVLTTWGLGANWACFQARQAEPFPEASSRERCGRHWALARGSDVATGRPSWKDDPGLGDVVPKHDPSEDRDVEVVMAGCCGRLEEETHG